MVADDRHEEALHGDAVVVAEEGVGMVDHPSEALHGEDRGEDHEEDHEVALQEGPQAVHQVAHQASRNQMVARDDLPRSGVGGHGGAASRPHAAAHDARGLGDNQDVQIRAGTLVGTRAGIRDPVPQEEGEGEVAADQEGHDEEAPPDDDAAVEEVEEEVGTCRREEDEGSLASCGEEDSTAVWGKYGCHECDCHDVQTFLPLREGAPSVGAGGGGGVSVPRR